MKTIALSISMPAPVREALAGEAARHGRELTDHVVRLLEEHAIRNGLLESGVEQDILLGHSLRDRAVSKALDLVSEGGFRPSITHDAIQAVCEDQSWLDDYKKLVRDDPYKTGNPRKQNINQNLGYYIKKALGARSKAGPDGKPANVKVKGAIIQSYTPLEL